MNPISAVHSQAVFHRHTAPQPQPSDQTGGNKQPANPAQSARAAVIDRPDLSSKPFGSLVSLFARGLPLPPSENAGDLELSSDGGIVASSDNPATPEI
jgi:hypothetical protein